MKLYVSLILIIILSSLFATAQKRELIQGSMDELKGQHSFIVKFNYSGMLVGSGVPEKKYLSEKKRAWDEEEYGKGTAFVAQWFNDRPAYYQPAFIKSFEKYAHIQVQKDSAKYTIIVKTKRTEGGWNIGITSHLGEIDGEIWIVDFADESKVIAVMAFYNFAGKEFRGGDFQMTQRIQSAYDQLGKWLGFYFKKHTKAS